MASEERSNRSSGSPRRGGPGGRGGTPGKKPGGDARRGGPTRPHSSGKPARAPSSRDRAAPRRDKPTEDTAVSPVFPAISPDVAPDQLDRQARRELSGLGKEDAEFVAKHLVMASRVVDHNPELAHEHAKAALHKGSRIPVVRETLGITAYLTGDFALCLRELRTHRRLSGQNTQLPMMVDAERGLGRPERGIELARGVDRTEMPDGWQVELAIALSGARLDLGQLEEALFELQIPQLNADVAYSYSPGLFDAYALVLEDLGRSDEAAQWGKAADVAARALEEKHLGEQDGVGDVFDLDTDPDLPEPAATPQPAPIDPVAPEAGPEESAPSDLGFVEPAPPETV